MKIFFINTDRESYPQLQKRFRCATFIVEEDGITSTELAGTSYHKISFPSKYYDGTFYAAVGDGYSDFIYDPEG